MDGLVHSSAGQSTAYIIVDIPLLTGKEYDQSIYVNRQSAIALSATNFEYSMVQNVSRGDPPMGTKFWVQFAVSEALGVLEVYVASSNLSAVQKTSAEKLIADGQAFLATL